jgi:hypothetical protein
LRFGIENVGPRRPIKVYTDEIQEFAPADFSSAIDLVLGSQMRFILVHHHAEQFNERLRMSVETNARIKILGGGLSPEVRKHYAEIAYARQLAEDAVKQAQISHITDYDEEEAISIHEDPEGKISTTTSPRLIPTPMEIVTGYDFYSPEEKREKAATKFLMPDRTFAAILPDGRVEQFTVPTLRRYLYNSKTCLKFIETHPFHEPVPERSNHASPRTRAKKPGLFHAE